MERSKFVLREPERRVAQVGITWLRDYCKLVPVFPRRSDIPRHAEVGRSVDITTGEHLPLINKEESMPWNLAPNLSQTREQPWMMMKKM